MICSDHLTTCSSLQDTSEDVDCLFQNTILLKDENEVSDKNSVQIMTIHKAKGDEFDYVFVPEMSDKLFSLNSNNIKISTESHFCECLKPKEKRRTIDEMKQEHLDETLHIIWYPIKSE